MKLTKIIYFIQLIICSIIGLYFICSFDINTKNSELEITKDVIFTGIICIIIICNLFRHKNKYLNISTRWFSIVALPYTSIYFLTEFFYILGDKFKNFTDLFEGIYLLILLFWYLPLVKIELAQVSNHIGRIFIVIIIYLEIVATPEYLILNHLAYILYLITISNIDIGFTFFGIGAVLIKEWHFSESFNLKLLKNKNFYIPLVLILILIGIWFAFYEQFLGNATSIPEALWGWINQLSFMSYNWTGLLRSLNVISEETERYLLLTLFLGILKNIKLKVPLTIVITAIIFSLNHYIYNLTTANPQSLYNVSLQAISAFGVGLFAATLYLYSGKFWLMYMFHAFVDFIAFSVPVSVQLNLTIHGLSESLLITLPLISVFLFMLFGKPRKVMEINAERIIS
ncbi:MAG: type II CAAX prenyl endopeptidase Rce1 family protein [Lactobacillus sp.]